MNRECRKFIDSLYLKGRNWKDSEIVDVVVYYNEQRFSVRYNYDVVYVFDMDGNHVYTFSTYEKFVNHIGGGKENGN